MSDLGNCDVMAKNIQHYMKITGKSRREVCSDLGVAYSTFSDWVNGKKYPRIDKIERMANYFGITKADLVESPATLEKSLGDTESELLNNNLEHQVITDDEQHLLTSYRKLNDKGKETATVYVDGLTMQEKYQQKEGLQTAG